MTVSTALLERLEGLTLLSGGHKKREDGMCAMEAAAFVAGEPHTDRPECVCPVIAAFMRSWNDNIDDDALRTELILPLIPKVIGSRGSQDDKNRRSYLMADWCQRVLLPLWCDLAKLDDIAAKLRALPEASTLEQITDPAREAVVSEARNACAKARATADAAAAAYAAAYASAAAYAAAYASAAADAYAYAAALAALRPTREAVWRSIPAMIERLLVT